MIERTKIVEAQGSVVLKDIRFLHLQLQFLDNTLKFLVVLFRMKNLHGGVRDPILTHIALVIL